MTVEAPKPGPTPSQLQSAPLPTVSLVLQPRWPPSPTGSIPPTPMPRSCCSTAWNALLFPPYLLSSAWKSLLLGPQSRDSPARQRVGHLTCDLIARGTQPSLW